MIDGLAVLGVAAFAVPLAVIWLVVAVLRLRRQVRDLDARLSIVASHPAVEPALDVLTSSGAQSLDVTPPPLPLAADRIAARLSAGREDDIAEGPSEANRARSPGSPQASDAVAEPLPANLSAPSANSGRTWPMRLGRWLKANWIYGVSAVSLALAGVFLVQYGAERGLLTPEARVLAALTLGVALLVAGEVVRRRSGDEGPTSTRGLPSTFSAAGLVVLYGAILAARGVYELIGPETAFAGLLVTALVGLVFGWFYGPFLAGGAIVGAGAAPFLVSGSGGEPGLLHAYYGLLGLSGLAIDAVRRWGWVSGLTLFVAFGGASLVWAGLGGTGSLVALLMILALAAVAVPRLERAPTHPGPSVLAWTWRRGTGHTGSERPVPPTFVAWGGIVGASALLWLVAAGTYGSSEQLLVLSALTGLALVLVLWSARAPGLEDAALAPVVFAFAALPILQPFETGPDGTLLRPWIVTFAFGCFLAVALAAYVRSLTDRRRAAWAGVSMLLPFLTAIAIEVAWNPASVLGAWSWALHVMAAAALVTLLGVRHAARDAQDRRPAAYAALSALSLIALALVVLLSNAALTVAFAVLVAAAAALDRRFRLPEVARFVLLGIAALGWRLIAWPGLPAFLDNGPGGAPWGEVVLSFGSALAGLWIAAALLPKDRASTRASTESALLAFAGVFACVIVYRITAALTAETDGVTHWSVGLFALIWGILALTQAHRARLGGPLSEARRLLAWGEAVVAGLFLASGAVALNPVFAAREVVEGPWLLDTLLLGFAAPAAGLALASWRTPWQPGRDLLAGTAAGFGALWAVLAIRRLWHQDLIWTEGVVQPELYAYTVALLAAGGILLARSLARGSPGLRRLAMGMIGLAIAKVFLVDAAGLTGLLRVASFLALGIVLAGLAWLNRWVADRTAPPSV